MSASSIGPPDILTNLEQFGATGGGGAFSTGPLWSAKGWKPPVIGPLPPDFLRVKKVKQGHAYTHPDHRPEHSPFNQEMIREKMSENEKKLGSLSSHTDLADLQMLEDEKFALMLQNEEFMAELRGNDEFLSALHEDHDDVDQPMEMGSKKSGGHHMDDAAFKEKLRNMGKSSKHKFAKLAMMFRQRGGNRLLGHAPAPSKDNLLLDAENYVEQHNSDSEDERHSTTKVNR